MLTTPPGCEKGWGFLRSLRSLLLILLSVGDDFSNRAFAQVVDDDDDDVTGRGQVLGCVSGRGALVGGSGGGGSGGGVRGVSVKYLAAPTARAGGFLSGRVAVRNGGVTWFALKDIG